MIPKRDVTLQTSFDQYDGGIYYREPIRKTFVASASYVTGSHNIKVGWQYGFGYFARQRREAADLIQLYRNNAPAQVIIHNTPQVNRSDMNADQGIYAQDQWTVGRFTINPGVRFEHFNSSIEGLSSGGRPLRAGRAHSRTCRQRPNWNDISPRLGFAWDVKGDGKTAVKAGWGSYLRAYSSGFADTYDPNFYTVRDADVAGPEQRQHRAGRHQLPAQRDPRAVRVSVRRAARSTSRPWPRRSAPSRCRPTRPTSSGRSRTR